MSSATINTKTQRSDKSMVLSRWCLGVATCLAVLCFAATGNAQTPWTNPGGGFWHTGSNWAGGLPPGPAGTAIFTLPNTYSVLWNDGFGDSFNAQLVVGAGNVTFSNTSASTRTYSVAGNSVITGSGATLTVGSFPGNIMQLSSAGYVIGSGGQLIATAGSKIITPGLMTVGSAGSGTLAVQAGGVVNAKTSTIGSSVGSTGVATVTGAGSLWSITGFGTDDLTVGEFGTGTLNVINNGVLETKLCNANIGLESGSSGHVTVDSAFWDGDNITVGFAGTGTLDVENGGFVRSTNAFFGEQSGSSGTATVSGSGSQWNLNVHLWVGVAGTGTLNIENGGGVYSGFGRNTIGYEAGSSGAVTVNGSGSKWDNLFDLFVGDAGAGTLNVENGGIVFSSSQGTTKSYIGFDSGSTGTATVTGIGSKWHAFNELIVGNAGVGHLYVTAGGVVEGRQGIIAANVSIGSVLVTGNGSQWNNSGLLSVGHSGGAIMNVNNGGVVNNLDGFIGFNSGSVGQALVGDSGSQWNNSSYLIVGYFGQGELTIVNNGLVTNTAGVVAQEVGSYGRVSIADSGARWNNSAILEVGRFGYGKLDVSTGGVVTNTFGLIANEAGSIGVVEVADSGSQWNSSQNMHVGMRGEGTLIVRDGGVVSNVLGSIAQENGSLGVATVTGNGSQWNNSSILVVGNNSATGTLNVTAGGVVTNTQGFIANEGPSTGVVTVDGSGSRWINSSNLYVGHKGAGTLNIQSGGEVTNTNANIGLHFGSSAVVTVTGAGSKWANSEYLIAGSSGHGTLNVAAGGAVTNTDGVIGFVSGSVGTALVTGANSKWTNSGFLIVGNSGNGTLNVEAGGAVTNTDAVVGKDLGSTGTATVTGAGSKWTNSGFLAVGQSGAGSLNVSAGGVVTNTGWGYVGSEPGSVGTATVTGSGSQWNISDSLEVGRFGNGTLNIANGGSVNVANLTAIDLGSQINNSNGSLVSNTVINQAGGEIWGHGQFSALGGWSNSGAMAFGDGTSNVMGAVSNLTGGSISTLNNSTTVFHGDVVHNGAEIRTSAGSRTVIHGAVSGAGSFPGTGIVELLGDARPGNGPAVVHFGGDLVLGDTSRLFIEIGGTAVGSQFDQVTVAGSATVDGSLPLVIINNFQPQTGNLFEIISAGSLSGNFASVSGQNLGGGLLLNPLTTSTSLSLLAALPGDANLNKAADFADLGILLNNFNVAGFSGVGQWNAGDFNDDHTVNFSDLGILLNNFNQSVSLSANSSVVPEPSALALAAMGALGLLLAARHCGPQA